MKIMTSESIKLFLVAGSNTSWGGGHSLVRRFFNITKPLSSTLCFYWWKGHGEEKSCSSFSFIMFVSDLDSRQVIQIQGLIYLKAELRQWHPGPLCLVCAYHCWPISAGLTASVYWFSPWRDAAKPLQNNAKNKVLTCCSWKLRVDSVLRLFKLLAQKQPQC